MLDLTGKLLIAMPGMGDPRFEHSVVFICQHTDQGAMGLIVNKPVHDIRLSDLLEQLDINPEPEARDKPIHFGGPVENARGFVLHSPDYTSSLQSMEIADGFSMTATLDVLEDIALATGPERALVMLGYAGWGPGQLEEEISMNGWLTADAASDLVFTSPDENKWAMAMETLGVNPLTLSANAGHA